METNTTMMICRSVLSWFGDSSGPVAVYDAANLTVLGLTEGKVDRDGSLTFGGVKFTTKPAGNGSNWLLLHYEG